MTMTWNPPNDRQATQAEVKSAMWREYDGLMIENLINSVDTVLLMRLPDGSLVETVNAAITEDLEVLDEIPERNGVEIQIP